MTSVLGLKLQEAIDQAEARKAMAQWDQPVSLSEATFNMVRDNPGKTKSQLMELLNAQGYKPTSTTSLLSSMLRYKLLVQAEDKTLTAVGTKYAPRMEFLNRTGTSPEARRKVVMVRRPAPVSDPVNHPEHYKVGGIETIDFIEAKLTPEEFKGYLKGNVLKYASRAGHKDNAIEDAGKLAWYANKLAGLA